MQRRDPFQPLSLSLGIGGSAALAWAPFADAATMPLWVWTASALLLAAVLAGQLGRYLLRKSCRKLAREIAEIGRAGPRDLNCPSAELASINHSINAMLDAANESVASAAMTAKELEIQLKVATAERQHAESILYSISDAVIVTDAFDELILANESAARTFEFDLEQSRRSPLQQVLRDTRMIELIREMRRSNTRNGRRIVEHQVRTPAGTRTFKITLSSIDDGGDGDSAAGVVAVLHDMTHEREISEMKNQFVSNVSHELRTPLASIKAYVELLIDGEADDEKTKREFYEVIQNEANRLGRLIDNILNISRIESGLVKINKQPQSLTVIIKDALEVIAPQAAHKQIAITDRLTPVFYQTLADRDMLYQAVLNLLSNAVKYTPSNGEISLETEVNEAQRKVLLRVRDTGVGIPPKDLPFVFDKFYRSESNNRMAPGTGLGLSLVKHIVETVHHGRIFVESEVGRGSCFGVELDLCE